MLSRLTPQRAAIIGFVVALFVSILMIQVVRPLLKIDRPLGGEAYDGYLELAQNLVAGNGYVFEPGGHKVFHRPPLYPALLVPGMFLPEGAHRVYVAVLNSVIYAFASMLVFVTGKMLFNQKIGAFAWCFFVFNPFMLIVVKNAVPATLQTFAYVAVLFLTLRTYLRIRSREQISFGECCVYALACWVAVMSHGTMLAVSLLLLGLLAMLAVRFRAWSGFRAIIVIGLLLAAAVTPWTWRNYRVTGLFIPVVGNSGLAYFSGNAHWGITLPAVRVGENRHEAEFRHMGLDPKLAAQHVRYYGMNDPQLEAYANDRMKAHLRAEPGDFAWKVFLNSIEFYWPVIYYIFPPAGTVDALAPDRIRIREILKSLPQSIFNLIFASAAAVGIFRLCRIPHQRWKGLSLWLVWALVALPYFPFLTHLFGRSYYPFGTYPVLALLAATLLVPRRSLECEKQW